jgi:hypothetical protein
MWTSGFVKFFISPRTVKKRNIIYCQRVKMSAQGLKREEHFREAQTAGLRLIPQPKE